MKMYIAPSLNKHGNSIDIVKGSCGFGVENWTLDRTGARRANWRTRVSRTTVHRVGNAQVFRTTTTCQIQNRCATGHHLC